MQRFFSILADAVHRFEGTVDKFTGDGIMAVFGAPIAHEDHAQRACYAALQMLDDVAEYAAELRREHGPQLLGPDRDQLRRGGRRRDRRRRRGRLHGDRPHGRPGAADGGAGRARQGLPDRAHRRARRAATSTSRTSASSRSRARAGRSGSSSWPGSARRARGSTSRASAASPASSAATRRWRRSRRRSSAAEAGDGGRDRRRRRTRASARAASATSSPSAAAARGIEVFEAQAQAHGKAIPFMPVLQMLRAYFGIADRDPERLAREKIAGRALLLDPGLRRGPAAALRLPRRPRPRPAGAAAERRGAPARPRRRRLPPRPRAQPAHRRWSLVIEDLHWIDEGSEALLAELVGAVEGTQDPGGRQLPARVHAALGASSPIYRQIALEPLGPRRHRRAAARPGRRATPRSTASTS